MDAQGHVTVEEVRAALNSIYDADIESNLQKALLRSLQDDLKPINEKGRWKPSPLVLLVVVLILAMAGVFLYFSIGDPR